jgi:4'-phosphopantetheinyl transferase
MHVYWGEQTEIDVPADNNWLSRSELLYLSTLRFPKRHNDWRLGRWAAKRTLALRLGLPARFPILAKIEIRPAASGAPVAFFEDRVAAATISLSHRNGRAVCALAPGSVQLGCDLEFVEPHTDAFLADYFTREEQKLVAEASAADRSRLLTLIWSAKESALKALHMGLRLDTRAVVVKLIETGDLSGWRPLRVCYAAAGQVFDGWWRSSHLAISTLVGDPSPDLPILSDIPAYSLDRDFKFAFEPV